jgi:hypothetical protein
VSALALPAGEAHLPMTWPVFLKQFGATCALGMGLVLALIVLMNPFGNLPMRAFGPHVVMDTNDRFQFPAIVRTGAYDSIVVGTSSVKLLDPIWLERAFGGRFANLGFNDGRAWEEYQLASLFLRTVKRPGTLLFGIDWVWCAADADANRITRRGFPPWIYDDVAWNDWLYILNWRGLETALRQLANHFGLLAPRFPANGYDVFVPPEREYDAAKARQYVWRGRPSPIVPLDPPYAATDEVRMRWQYPALSWLDEVAGKAPAGTRLIFAFMPAHVAGQPQPGSQEAAREAECKARMAQVAMRRGAHLIDFKIASEITGNDANYWDTLHYRLPIAERIVAGIATAVATGKDDPRGDWRYRGGPARP